MDPNALLQCFEATYNADQAIRQNAEAQLRKAQEHIGFLGICLDILSSTDVDFGTKQASALFFKNRICRYWKKDSLSEQSGKVIDEDEKPIIRDRLLPTLVSLPLKLRKHLVPVLEKIVASDYPQYWPSLVDNALQLLYTQNLDAAYTGLLCFAKIASSFRWMTNKDRPALDELIIKRFPTLLQAGESLLKEESLEAGEMAVLLLKTYKYSTYHDLPEPLQTPENFTQWGNFHVNIISKPLPQSVLQLDERERRLHPWVKAKKWAYANLNRLFDRYARKTLSVKFDYAQFRVFFTEQFAPQLLSLYFTQIEEWCAKRLWLSDELLHHLIKFLDNAVTRKSTWPLIKTHYETLVSHFIFPLLCPSDETLECFEHDPTDYIHTKLVDYIGNDSPDRTALELLVDLTSKRKKTTLENILQFVFGVLTSLKDPASQSLEDSKKLEGALRFIGTLSDHFTKNTSPYYPQMEEFLSTLIIPHFNNPHAFIKARTCEVVAKFSEISFKNDANLGALYRGILGCFEDDHLPIQLEAALALQSFVKIPEFQEALGNVIVPTIQRLLQLSNDVDAEPISNVMQDLVEVYSEQLQPFGVDLMSNLVEQFLRLSKELNDFANIDPDAYDDQYEDNSEKSLAALGLLNTMITVLLSFESSHEVVFKLEETFFPVIDFVFTNEMDDFFREAGELIENSTFLTRAISPVAWRSFGLIIQCLAGGIGILYMEDLMPAMNNFLIYGANEFKTTGAYTDAVIHLLKYIMGSDNCKEPEMAYGGEIAQKLILALEDLAEPYIELILKGTIDAVVNCEGVNNNHFAVNMVDVVVASLVHHKSLALSILNQGNFIMPFFELWFKYVGEFTRVYDMKLSVLGLLSLVTLSEKEIAEYQLASFLPQFGHKLAILMGKLPTAIQELDKKRKEYDGESIVGKELGYSDEWYNEDVEEDAEAPARDDYLDFLTEEAKKLNSGGFGDEFDEDFDDELVEDAMANTILDSVNVFYDFKETALKVQSADSNRYQQLFGGLTAEEQEILQTVIEL